MRESYRAQRTGCVNGMRLLVERSIYPQYLQMLQAIAAHIKVGDPLMNEFVLQYAIHGGWPRASVMQSVVLEMGERVMKGLPYA